MGSIETSPPPRKQRDLQLDLSQYAALDAKQVGHLRHFYNLVSQSDGSWHHMGSQEPMQEFSGAYRYQLATMAYAASAAHFHREPALRSVYKPLLRRIIHKMLCRDVWGYWFMTSHSGSLTEPDRTELRKPWADPVTRENIMYSGHLLLMTSLYGMLFDDDEFEKPNSIVFKWTPLFWGFGPEIYSYDNRSLQKVILAEMERNHWVGSCCEPNLVFVVCNQFPIIAMRYNDVRDGTNVADEVTDKYKKAWDKAGMVQSDGLFADWLMVKQQLIVPPKDAPHGSRPPRNIGFTAWAAAYMHAWNSEFVESKYEQQVLGYVTSINGQFRIRPAPVASAFRALVNNHSASPDSEETFKQAVEDAKTLPPSWIPFHPATYGHVCQWLSELGRKEELKGVLDYTDKHLNPTWERGGLFYPRQDEQIPDSTDITYMEPHSGNAGIGYSRLNVPNGQKIMWERPWAKEILATRPWIDGISLENGVDYLRGCWDESKKALIFTARTWDASQTVINPRAQNLSHGEWSVYVNKEFRESRFVKDNGSFEIDIAIGGEPVDVVFKRTGPEEFCQDQRRRNLDFRRLRCA